MSTPTQRVAQMLAEITGRYHASYSRAALPAEGQPTRYFWTFTRDGDVLTGMGLTDLDGMITAADKAHRLWGSDDTR